MKHLIYLFVVSLLFSCFRGNAQELFEKIYAPEGAVESFNVTDIKQDWRGQLWLANYGEGLVKFDGNDFTQYDKSSGLSSIKVRCLTFDENGNLWVGSVGGGISIQEGDHFISFTDSIAEINENVYSLFYDNDETIWIGTNDGLHFYRNGQLTSLHHSVQFPNVPIQSIVRDRFGTIWAGSWQSGLYAIKINDQENDQITFQSITEKQGLLSDNISSLEIDHDGNLIIGTFRGMQRGIFENGTLQLSLNATKGLPTGQVFDIENHPQYGMCLAFGEDGIFHFDYSAKSWKSLPLKNKGFAYALFSDRENFFWVSNWEESLLRVNNTFVSTIDAKGIIDHSIRDLVAQNNSVYLTYSEKILRLEKDSILNLTEGIYFESPISHITTISKNELIVNYTSGLSRFKNNEWKDFSGFKEFINRPVTAIGKDVNGHVWIAMKNAPPIIFDGETFSIIRSDEFNDQIDIDIIEGAPNGDVWLHSKSSGLIRIRGSEVSFVKNAELKNGKVLDFDFDVHSNLWFASQSTGVGYIDSDFKVHFLTEKLGLPTDTRSILIDSKQNLWVGTKIGLFAVTDISVDSNESHSTIHININEGLPNNSCLARLIAETSDCHIYIATKGGIGILNAAIVSESNTPIYPEIYIDEIKIDFKSVDWRKSGFELNKRTLLPENLKLKSYQSQVSFNLNSHSFKNTENNYYKYKLEGLEEEYSPISNAPFITFHDLRPGNFTLIIQPCNVQGDCSEYSFKYSFSILKPFHRTWWFYSIVCVLVIVLFYIIIRLREKSQRHAKKILEKRVEFRTKEIRTQKRIIEENNRDITASIKYAKRIQRGFLPLDADISKIFKEYFAMYLPKNMVSGDFYMVNKFGEKKLLIVSDCTGHGVPGAMMSMLGYGLFIEAIQSKAKGSAAQIFDYTSTGIIHLLKQRGDEGGSQDGMDASLISYCPTKEEFEFVGANNSGFLIGDVTFESRDRVIEHHIGDVLIYELKPDKQPLGINKSGTTRPFTAIKGTAKPGTQVYLFSDGYADQFGSQYGINPTDGGKKFRIKRLRQKIAEVQHLPMHEQHKELHTTMSIWKGTQEQVDDITLIGVKL